MHSTSSSKEIQPSQSPLPKAPTGIQGLDEITGGGLPEGRPTLVCGGSGSGKTLLSMEFLVRGAVQYGEPGVFVTFEETAEELTQNVASLGYDLNDLCAQKKLVIDHIYIEPNEIEETGPYDLEGLFVRLGHAIDSISARRVALDTLEALFGGVPNEAILRAELRRLFRWLKNKGVTAIITAERGDGMLTRQGLEEYVSDCVLLLDHRVTDQISTRRLQVVKYRGSLHGTNEYPFLIDQRGFSVMPITSAGLDYAAPVERVSTGIERLDSMLGGGVYRGSSVLLTGTTGTGKSSVAVHFAAAACRRGERVLYLHFEESARQIIRDMRSIGIDLEPWVRDGLLRIQGARATFYGLELHLLSMHRWVEEFQPRLVILDPITNLLSQGTATEIKVMLTRLIDVLKSSEITLLFTSLTAGGEDVARTDIGISSLMDTWILLRDLESNGERNRGLYLVKSRGMAHSNQIREFLITDQGVQLRDVYVGPSGTLTGAARLAQEARDEAESLVRQQEIGRKQREIERKRQALEARIEAQRAEFESEEEALRVAITQAELHEEALAADRAHMAELRRSNGLPAESGQ